MKAGIAVILCIVSAASCNRARAGDTADQAAARAAVEQKLNELDHSDARPSPDSNSAPPATHATASSSRATNAAPAPPAATAPADTVFTANIPAANASAQTAALFAMQQRMNELGQPGAQPAPATNAAVAPVVIPANEASASAMPLTEAPAAEAPVAVAPAIATVTVTPVSSVPAVVGPAPKVATAPAAAAAVAASPGTDTRPTRTLPNGSASELRPSNELVTTSGATYRNVEVQKITSEGIVISYTPAQGGWAMTKVYFKDLPPEIRQQYEK